MLSAAPDIANLTKLIAPHGATVIIDSDLWLDPLLSQLTLGKNPSSTLARQSSRSSSSLHECGQAAQVGGHGLEPLQPSAWGCTSRRPGSKATSHGSQTTGPSGLRPLPEEVRQTGPDAVRARQDQPQNPRVQRGRNKAPASAPRGSSPDSLENSCVKDVGAFEVLLVSTTSF